MTTLDQMVLTAQQWVNATYQNRAGYVPCDENGQTGWKTMYSLTRALQLELGITTPSDSFGPGTLSKLQSKGPIGPGESNTNIVKIIQSGLYCKGYSPGAISGSYGTGTQNAVTTMMGNMGVGSYDTLRLQPKVFKALLTMDAYVLLSGGTQAIRSIQVWLNARYYPKSTFYIAPADGNFTRDVQKALMMGLQYEFGIADAQVTGNFGPATQQGLKDHPVARGDSGIFVRLFSAACVFNGSVRAAADQTPVAASFTDSFDANLETWVKAFQRFSYLNSRTGTGNYETWAQLLVSQGDADRAASGCDTADTITATRGTGLKRDLYKIVGRYLVNAPGTNSLNKKLQPGELATIHAAGLRMFPIMQIAGRAVTDFTRLAGQSHAIQAHDAAVAYGLNSGVRIYFAVDYDATDAEISSNILNYFRGVKDGFASSGNRYGVGVYGSRNVCAKVSGQGLATASFVSGMSYGFSGNLGFTLPSNWALNQIQEVVRSSSGDSYGLDRCVYRPEVERGVGPENVGQTQSPVTQFLDYVDRLYQCATDYLRSNSSTANKDQLVLSFLRDPEYTFKLGWPDLLYTDGAWIDYAQSNCPKSGNYLLEPARNINISIDHMAAAAATTAVYGTSSPTSSRADATRGDFGGWMGDLVTFYTDWRMRSTSYASGYAFCQDQLANSNYVTSFGLTDFIEDADGFAIGQKIRSGVPVNQALRAHYSAGGAYTTRFKTLWDTRFGSDPQRCVAISRSALLGGNQSPEDGYLIALTQGLVALDWWDGSAVTFPQYLPEASLTSFLEGWTAVLQRFANGKS